MGGLYVSIVLLTTQALHVWAVLDTTRQCGLPWSQLAMIPLMEEYNRPDSVVEAITSVLSRQLSDTMEVDAVELKEESTYVCCAQGVVNGFQGITLEKTSVMEGTEDTTDIHIIYSFKDLHFGFGKYAQHMPPIPDITGSIDVSYGYNAVELVINTESYSKMITMLKANECFVRVKEFAVKSLLSKKVNVNSKSILLKYLTSKTLNLLVENNQAQFRKRIEGKLQLEIYKALAASGSWICQDDALLYPILENKYGYTDVPTYSKEFDSSCGSNED